MKAADLAQESRVPALADCQRETRGPSVASRTFDSVPHRGVSVPICRRRSRFDRAWDSSNGLAAATSDKLQGDIVAMTQCMSEWTASILVEQSRTDKSNV